MVVVGEESLLRVGGGRTRAKLGDSGVESEVAIETGSSVWALRSGEATALLGPSALVAALRRRVVAEAGARVR